MKRHQCRDTRRVSTILVSYMSMVEGEKDLKPPWICTCSPKRETPGLKTTSALSILKGRVEQSDKIAMSWYRK